MVGVFDPLSMFVAADVLAASGKTDLNKATITNWATRAGLRLSGIFWLRQPDISPADASSGGADASSGDADDSIGDAEAGVDAPDVRGPNLSDGLWIHHPYEATSTFARRDQGIGGRGVHQ